MSKSKAKIKEESNVAAPKRRERVDQEVDDAARAAKRAETLRVWKEEVKALTSREFPSIEAAVQAVTEQLAKRMGISVQEQEFLQLLLSTDPTLTAELQRNLRIK